MRLQLILAFAIVCGLSMSAARAQQTAKISPAKTAYLEYLPQDYNKNTNKYPIVVFLHGIGERGTTSTDQATLLNSVQNVAKVGLAKYIKNGTNYPFIVISPQLKSSYGTWPANYVMEVLNHVRTYLRIDEQRVYITGLSLGGFGTWTTLAAYPDQFAAAVPICSGGNAVGKACTIAAKNVPIWAFHGTADNTVSYTVTTNMVNAINSCTPKPSPLAKTTLFSGLGHNIWDKVYKETDAVNWMLSYRKGSTSGSTTNIAPVANAGPDKTTSSTSITLTGSGTDKDGRIVSYQWTQYGGAAATLTNANTATVTISGLKDGNYYFRLTVKDDKGASDFDNMMVTVKGASTTNIAPVANAGPDKTTSATSITLTGSGTDKDGKIVSYQWTQYGGATATLTNANSATVTISGLKNGKYYFRLTVKDDKGASHYDNMMVTVSGVSTTNTPPVANAGKDLTTSGTSITIAGSGTDKDGKIASYKWTQYGGAATTMTNTTTPKVTVSGLKPGKYYFRLTVTDDKGASDFDNMLLVVK
jgi:dienelactone hydrolase